MFFWMKVNPFYIVNCLKPFDMILFFAYTLKLLMGLPWHIYT